MIKKELVQEELVQEELKEEEVEEISVISILDGVTSNPLYELLLGIAVATATFEFLSNGVSSTFIQAVIFIVFTFVIACIVDIDKYRSK